MKWFKTDNVFNSTEVNVKHANVMAYPSFPFSFFLPLKQNSVSDMLFFFVYAHNQTE